MRYRVNPNGGTVCDGGQFPPGSFIELDPVRARSLGDSLELGADGRAIEYGDPEPVAPEVAAALQDDVIPEAESASEVETTAIEAPPVDRMIRRGRTVRK